MKHKGEKRPSSNYHGPVVQGGTTHASSRRKAWRYRAIRDRSPLRQGAGICLLNLPELGFEVATASGRSFWKIIVAPTKLGLM